MHISSDWVSAVGVVIGAVGTVSTFGVALRQLARESRARREDERLRATAARRAQAIKVSAWVSGRERIRGMTWLAIHNGSDAPVYQAVVSLVKWRSGKPEVGRKVPADLQSILTVVPPGAWFTSVSGDWMGQNASPAAEIAFVDHKGNSWLRSADGMLVQLDQLPIEQYQIGLPTYWATPLAGLPDPDEEK